MKEKYTGMHNTKKSVLAFFRSHPGEHTTSAIVQGIFTEESTQLHKDLESVDSEVRKKALATKSKLHRRVTHHLNVLVRDGILQVANVIAKGEKSYLPNIADGQELVVQDASSRIVLSRPGLPTMPMDLYEYQQMVHKVLGQDWLTRHNAFAVIANQMDANRVAKCVHEVQALCNDVVGIVGAEHLLKDKEFIQDIINIEQEFVQYDKKICLHLRIEHCLHELHDFLKQVLPNTSKALTLVLAASNRTLIVEAEICEPVIALLAQHDQKCNIQSDVNPSPILVGRAGPYAISPDDWQLVQKKEVVSFASLSVLVDLNEVYNTQAKVLQDCILASAKSLFIGNVKARALLQDLQEQTVTDTTIDLFTCTRNTIRLWNVDVEDQEQRQQRVTTLHEINTQLKSYARTQEIIYLSCGMPIPFRVDFGQGYRRFDNELLKQTHKDIVLRNTQDLYTKEFKNQFLFAEQIATLMHNTSELRIVRTGSAQASDIVREITSILGTYRIPLLCMVIATESAQTLERYVS